LLEVRVLVVDVLAEFGGFAGEVVVGPVAVGCRPGVGGGAFGDLGVLDVVGDLVGGRELVGAVGQGEDERAHAGGDDDGREDHRLGQRVGVDRVPAPFPAADRRVPGGAAGGEDEQVDAVGQDHDPQQDLDDRPFEQQVDAGRAEDPGEQQECEVGGHDVPPGRDAGP